MKKTNKLLVINGRRIGGRVAGVQRFISETLRSLDEILPKESIQVELAIPKGMELEYNYKHIQVVEVGRCKGLLWEQLELPFYIMKKNALGVHLCNSAPLLCTDILCIHDVSVRENPNFFKPLLRLKARMILFISTRNAKLLLTVSEFSKKEILRFYPHIKCNIVNIGSAWQHMDRISTDKAALSRYNLTPKGYYFAISSLARMKNFDWIMRVAKENIHSRFVIAGGVNKKVFSHVQISDAPKNVQFIGYVSDEESKFLMQNAKAFLFPSFYEGFGLPPLEALATDTPIIISQTSCLPEIYGDTAYYIDPFKYDYDLDDLLKNNVKPAASVLEKYSWIKTAEALCRSILQIYS